VSANAAWADIVRVRVLEMGGCARCSCGELHKGAAADVEIARGAEQRSGSAGKSFWEAHAATRCQSLGVYTFARLVSSLTNISWQFQRITP